MKSVIMSSLLGVILILGEKSAVFGCGERLGSGVVMCQLGNDKNILPFDFELCTHAHISTNTFLCTDNVCWPNNSTDFEKTVRWARPHMPDRLGFRIEFNQAFIDVIPNRLKRLNTAKRTINFMKERGFSFIVFAEDTQADVFKNELNRNSLIFIEEIASAIHNEGWHIGLSLRVGITELSAKTDLVKLSEFVDWFYLVTLRAWPNHEYLYPFLPISSSINQTGTAEYWITHVLQWLKPECVLLYVHQIGGKLTAEETAVEPGPGSKATKDPMSYHFLANICEILEANNCPRRWDEDTNTPWAACGDDYYTYLDIRSMELRTDLARRYKLAGMSAQVDTDLSGSKFCGHEDPLVFLRAMQGIRNVTVQ